MLTRRPLRLSFALVTVLAGCNALIDAKDIYLDPLADGGNGSPDATTDGNATLDGSTGEGGTEASPCNNDLQIDAKHCGRCGHDCQGGTCTAGKCDAVLLAASLGNPSGIALGPSDVYFTNYTTGTVVTVKKTGGALTTLATGETRARGAAVVGSTLYWGNGDFTFDDAGAKGGVWQCPLPACTTKSLLAPGGYNTSFPVPSAGFVYFGTGEEATVARVPLTGGAKTLVATTNSAFGIAADAAHVYFTSSQPSVYRAPLAGGTEEVVGALNGNRAGFVALDDQRAYWAFTDSDATGKVFSVAKATPSGATTSYGSAAENVNPVGVAVDAENIYWTTAGSGNIGTPVGDGKLFTCKKIGCGGDPPVLLAEGLNFGFQMALDDTAIYWVEYGTNNASDGRVRKVAKP